MDNPEELLFEIKPSRFGKGLFAKKIIPAFTTLCKATGIELAFSETVALGEKESHCLQIDTNKYILCDPPFLYSNHSCDPNCALNEKLELFTIRDIQKDEELVWDYSTSMYERHWTMQCQCGAAKCRKIISDFDLLPEDIQIEYLKRKWVLPFIACQFKDEFHMAFRA
ncbi:MAG: SET domain-containing protein-lysine N-methyltransferase [Flavisolibacter sp.]|nr:SET domain-containing protein-lysine N-methyltransferase [Flavisolibacter sp.]MBD0349731.1 SET domain-containing protein-lysine N-methyltransferase [Flavisolibacter sp.]MBD0374300.1 SET domain-containing protein-lysine N-methyltransferase [Flavisolibacter sp.]